MAPKSADLVQTAGRTRAGRKSKIPVKRAPAKKSAAKMLTKADIKGDGKKKKKTKKGVETYKYFLYKVLKQVCTVCDPVMCALLSVHAVRLVSGRVCSGVGGFD